MVTDRANVIRLEPDVKRHVRARLARLPAEVHALHQAGVRSLAALLLRYFDAADDALFDLADKAASNAEQNAYFDAMRELRVQRKSVERHLFEAIDELFARLVAADERDTTLGEPLSAEQLAIVAHDDLQQMVALEATINRASAAQAATLAPLVQALGELTATELSSETFPFGAYNLCHSAMTRFAALEMHIKAKLLLFHLFEQLVINKLGLVNEVLLNCLQKQGVTLPAVSDSAVAEQPLPADSAAPSGSHRELLSLLSFVQKLPLSAAGPDGLDVQRVLSTVQHRRGVELKLSRPEQEIINLVQMLFRFLLQGQDLAEPMQEMISRLQVPVLKAALIDPQFLADKKHPVRRLLNELAAEAAQWQGDSDDHYSQSVYQSMRACIERILARFDNNIGIFGEVLVDFTASMEKEKLAAHRQEQRTVQAEDGQARAVQARQHVNAEIAARTENKHLPPAVAALINGPWSNVLFVKGLQCGFGSAQWSAQLKTLSDLVWSVQPELSAAERKRLAKDRVDLVQRLRAGLESISYNPFEVEELFCSLDELHLAAIRAEPAPTATSSAHSPCEQVPQEGDVARPGAAEEQSPSQEHDAAAPLPDSDPHMIAVSAFSHGAWFDLTLSAGQSWRCRLAAYIKPTDKYIFVDRSGVKVAEQSRQDLAVALKQGRLTPLDNNMLFDRALESVVSSLRKTTTAMPFDKKNDGTE